jgi:hypothetical protein
MGSAHGAFITGRIIFILKLFQSLNMFEFILKNKGIEAAIQIINMENTPEKIKNRQEKEKETEYDFVL